ncbi:MAG TPA: DUF4375 domain-containing protein, partial [Flavipsychrobacter sp.]|nr:DUF4375 domain-containing protein [Flavipsychrobacter sp.]
MQPHFLPHIPPPHLQAALQSTDPQILLDLLALPLHQELYRRQDFNFMDTLTMPQQLLLSYDYTLQQVQQGGFIQLLVNGYIGLLPDMPQWLTTIGATPMAQLIDDVLKVYVLNHHLFRQDMTPREFALLYDELKEFEILETRYFALHPA